MNAGTIFVLCLAAGFVVFAVYLARLSRRNERNEAAQRAPSENEAPRQEPSKKPPMKRAG